MGGPGSQAGAACFVCATAVFNLENSLSGGVADSFFTR